MQDKAKKKAGLEETPWDRTKRELSEARLARAEKLKKLASLDFTPKIVTTTV